MIEYIGEADCHGIASLIPLDHMTEQDIMMMYHRSEANLQRHSLIFKTKLTNEQDKRVQALLNNNSPILALKLVKELVSDGKIKTFEISRGKEHLYKRIPNPKLDPMYKGGR